MRNTLGVWKTTILGGVFFLLPFAIVVFLIGQVAYVIGLAASPIKHLIDINQWSIGGVSLTFILATVLVLALCYIAGLAAQRSLGTRFAEKIERYLLMLFPRYGVLKDQLASNIGGKTSTPPMKPVLVTFDDASRLGFEVERSASGAVIVYMPGAPDPWQGHIISVEAARVAALAVPFGQAVSLCETMGRAAGGVLDSAKATSDVG
jgi:uncharacterized membrane protein